MTRVKGGTVARARRKKVLKEAKGYFGSKHRLYKTAHEQVMHSGVYALEIESKIRETLENYGSQESMLDVEKMKSLTLDLLMD